MANPIPVLNVKGITVSTNAAYNDPREGMDEELNYWLQRANDLPSSSRQSYTQQIHAYAQQARLELSKMQIAGQAPEAIKRYAQTAALNLRENALQLIEAHQTQAQKKLGLERKFRDMDVKIKNCGKEIDFKDFKPGPAKLFSAKEHLAGDPFWGEKWTNNQERMMLARMVGFVTEKVGEGIQMACEVKPNVGPLPFFFPDPVCSTLKATAVVFHELGKLPVIKDVIEEAHSPNIPLQNELYDQFGIPKEQAQQYSEDVFTKVAPLMIPTGIVGSVGLKGAITVGRGLKTFLKSDSGAVKLPVFGINESLLKLYKNILRNDKAAYVTAAIDMSIEKVEKCLPRFERLSTQTNEQFWNSVLGNEGVQGIGQNLKKNFARSVTKFSSGGQDLIAKQAFHTPKMLVYEVYGLHFLNSLGLKRLRVTTPLVFGKEEGSFFAIKPYVEGDTIASIFKNGTYSEIKETCYELGQMAGELQEKGRVKAQTASLQLVEEAISDFTSGFNGLDVPHNLNIPNLRLVTDFIKNPGQVTYGFYDIHSTQFVRAKNLTPSIGFFDGEMVPMTVTPSKNPSALSVQEFCDFTHMIAKEGELYRHTVSQVAEHQGMFREGFFSEFKGTWSPEAEKFFNVQSELNTLHKMKKEIIEHLTFESSAPNELNQLYFRRVEQLKSKLEN